MKRKHQPQEMHREQVRNTLRFIDETQPDEVKRAVFGRLGRECFYSRNLDAWIGQYTGDVQTFLDWVNVEHKSRYWERLEFTDDRTLVLTGRKVEGCACAFADCPHPPVSLCDHCCKTFQEELFGTLLGKPVDVTITEAFLRGDERCNTVISLNRVGSVSAPRRDTRTKH